MSDSTISGKFSINKGTFTLGVEFNVPSTGVFAIYGPSGCGKTTWLNAIAGFEKLSSDCFFKINNKVWQSKDIFYSTHKRSIGYVYQEPALFPHLNVQQNLEYGLKRTLQSRRKFNTQEVVELLHLSDLTQHKTSELSRGQSQRVAIAQALLTHPKLLLMDEPLSGLDQESKNKVFQCIETLAKKINIPIFYVSHSIDEILKIADYIFFMEKGRLVKAGPLSKFRNTLVKANKNNFLKSTDAKVIKSENGILTLQLAENTNYNEGQYVKVEINEEL